MKLRKRLFFFFIKLFNFEYWPFGIFYFPMYFYGLYLALKSRSFMYFSIANPGMKYGGVMGESKYKVLSSIPKQYLPKTAFITRSTSYSSILKIIDREAFTHPFIVKPDIGERGKDVEIVHSENELKSYLADKSFDLIIQEYIDYNLEFGILYHRIPKANQGQITSVVQKDFLSITGDGTQSLKELLSGEIRAKNRLDYLQNKFEKELDTVLEAGDVRYLEPIGNHCRGTTFYNANHLINEKLVKVFDEIAKQIEGYFYGRFDLRVPSLEDLYTGKNIKILELNGVSSEIAHVYDPAYKLLLAYKDIAWHMNIIYKIAKENRRLGHENGSLLDFLKDLRKHLKS